MVNRSSDIYSKGDSGGPVSMKSMDQHILVGDTSFGPGCILAGTMVIKIHLLIPSITVHLKNICYRMPNFLFSGGFLTLEPGWRSKCLV